MADFSNFECDKCGACCSMLVEAKYYDAIREPKLYQLVPDMKPAELRQDGRCIILWDKKTHACPFLCGETKHCTIYPTRPVECVLVEPGDAKCQQARVMKGLALLRDKNGNPPDRALLEESCDDYGLDYESDLVP